MLGPLGSKEFSIGGVYAGDKGSQMQTCRVLAGHDACSGWRADRCGGVGICKSHSLSGETVDIWRLVELTRIAAELI